MSKTVVVSVKVVQTQHPAGTVGGSWLFQVGMAGEPSNQKEQSSDPRFTFALDNGLYWAKVTRMDALGNLIGETSFGEFEVSDTEAEVTINTAGAMKIEIFE